MVMVTTSLSDFTVTDDAHLTLSFNTFDCRNTYYTTLVMHPAMIVTPWQRTCSLFMRTALAAKSLVRWI